jgi:hypothetical protein
MLHVTKTLSQRQHHQQLLPEAAGKMFCGTLLFNEKPRCQIKPATAATALPSLDSAAKFAAHPDEMRPSTSFLKKKRTNKVRVTVGRVNTARLLDMCGNHG